jgi:hypothetical protein
VKKQNKKASDPKNKPGETTVERLTSLDFLNLLFFLLYKVLLVHGQTPSVGRMPSVHVHGRFRKNRLAVAFAGVWEATAS